MMGTRAIGLLFLVRSEKRALNSFFNVDNILSLISMSLNVTLKVLAVVLNF